MTFFLTSNLFSSSKFETESDFFATVSNFDIDFSSSCFSREKLCTIFCGDNCLLNFSLVLAILGVNSTVVNLTEFSSSTVDFPESTSVSALSTFLGAESTSSSLLSESKSALLFFFCTLLLKELVISFRILEFLLLLISSSLLSVFSVSIGRFRHFFSTFGVFFSTSISVSELSGDISLFRDFSEDFSTLHRNDMMNSLMKLPFFKDPIAFQNDMFFAFYNCVLFCLNWKSPC